MGVNSPMARRDKRSGIASLLGYILALIIITVLSLVIRWVLPFKAFPIDLFLVAVITVALRKSTMSAQLFGFAAGLAEDAFSGGIIGINALSKTIIAYVVSILKEAVMIQGVVQRFLTYLLTSVANALLLAGINSVFSMAYKLDVYEIGYQTLINSLAGLLIIFYFKRKKGKVIASRNYEKP